MPDAANDGLGIALALGSCAALGLAIALARYAYEGGANAVAIVSVRMLVASLGLFALCVLTGRRLWPGRRVWLHSIGLGVLMIGMTYGNVGSVQYIPVGLAALLFYTFPPIIAVGEALLDRRLPAWMKLAAVAVAFTGLVLMLSASLGDADPRGLGLALLAAVCCAVHALWLGRRLGGVEIVAATLHMSLVGTSVLLATSVSSGAAVFPATQLGWFGLVGVVVLQAGGMPLYFMAIQRIGALRCAVFANIQPVVSLLAAYLLFGELLGPAQIAGGALVLAGIWLMQHHDRRRVLL